MTDRIAGALIVALATGYGLLAGTYRAGFTDPLGPAAFPQMLALPLGLGGLYLLLRPGADPVWPRGRALGRQLVTLAMLVAYTQLLELLGFPLTTLLAVTLLARLLGAAWTAAALTGLLMGIVLYVLFDPLLGLPLPLGPLAGR